MYLLDTNAVSAPRRPEGNRAVSQWLLVWSLDGLCIGAMTVGEIESEISRESVFREEQTE